MKVFKSLNFWIITAFVVVLVGASIGGFAFTKFQLALVTNSQAEQSRADALVAKNELRNAVSLSVQIISTVLEEEGVSGREHALNLVSEMIQNDGNYFWVMDDTSPIPNMIMHPLAPQLVGTTLSSSLYDCATTVQYGIDGDEQEIPGGRQNFFQAMVDAATRTGEGFVVYEWSKPADMGGVEGQTYPKLSYVYHIKELGLIVGQGMYIDDLDIAMKESREIMAAAISEMIEELTLWGGFGIILLVIMILIVTKYTISRPFNNLVAMVESLARGELDVKNEGFFPCELGVLNLSMLNMAETIKSIKNGIVSTADRISRGHLRDKIDVTQYDGEYSLLVEGINNLCKSYVNIIDGVPVIVMIRSGEERSVLFLNKTGSDVAEIDPIQAQTLPCHKIFDTDACGDGFCQGDCVCDSCFRDGTTEMGSTVAHLNREDNVDIDVFPIPLEIEGERVAVIEVVVDQTQIKAAQRLMIQVANEATTIANSVASAAEQLSAQIEQASIGARTQRDRTEETATAMEEMTATVREVANSASDADQSSREAKNRAQTGSAIVEKVVKSIELVQQMAEVLKSNMTELGDQAEGIGQIMNVITDIADQTNLLALNAAIEAARAGDAGRGFAVVADEVRKLAEKTMEATKEVGDAVSAIQDGAKRNIASTEEAVEVVEQSTDLANEAGKSLQDIVHSVDSTALQVSAIATAAEEQSAASDEINRGTTEINQISSETADSMDEATDAVISLSKAAQELQSLIQQLEK